MNFRRFFPVFAAGLALALCAQARDGSAHYVWTGVTLDAHGARSAPPPIVDEIATTRGDGAAVHTRANPRATADAHLRALAELELVLELDRDVAAAQRALDELWARAAWREEYHGRFEVLQELALARARLAERRGAIDEAHAALEQLLPGDALKLALGARFEFEPASEAQLAAERAALAAPAFAQKAATGGGAQGDRAWEKGVEATVRANFGTGTAEIVSLGALAAPALEKMLLEAPDTIHRADLDPLRLLVQVARVRAGTFLRANVNAGGFLWHQRILRALDSSQLLGSDKLWMFRTTDVPPTLVEPVWSEIVDALCDDRDVRMELLRALPEFVRHDALTPKMQAAIVQALDGADGSEVQAQAVELLRDRASEATVRAVAETALQSKSVIGRRAAARWLANEERSDALLALGRDPDADVRAYVAAALGPRKIERREFTPNSNRTSGRYFVPPLGPRERELLVTLLGDEQPSVRRQVAWVIAPLDPPLDASVYTRMAEDEDAVVRARLLEGLRSDHPALAAALERVSRRADAELFPLVDKRLADVAREAREREDDWFAPYLPALLRRLEHPELPQSDKVGFEEFVAVLRAAAFVPDGLNELTRRVVASPATTWLPAWSQALTITRRGRNTEPHPAVARLDGALLQQGFRRFFALNAESATVLAEFLQKNAAVPGHRAAWSALLADRSADPELRITAAAIVASAADDEFDMRLFELLALPLPASRTTERALRDIGASYASERAEALGLALVRDTRLPIEATFPLLVELHERGRSATWTTAVLARWMDDGAREAIYALRNALASLPPSDDAATVAYLQRAVSRPELWGAAIAAMGRMKKPVYLDLLAAEFASTVAVQSYTRDMKQIAVAEALASFLTDDAAERLLRGVPLAVDQDVRAKILEKLEQVRAYLDAKKRWNARASDADKRAEAVNSLVKLCDDAEPATRAQAAKGLAALDALEQLPKLIALLKDKSPEVRSAAQQALDVLNARAAAPATPPK